MNYRDTLKINSKGILTIGGVTATALVKKYGTPLYVMDVEYIRNIIRAFKNTIDKQYGGYGNVLFASKAFSCQAIYTVAAQEGIMVDVASGGELYTAISSGFSASKAYMHGNNKLIRELRYAIENSIEVIVVDNLEEVTLIDDICRELGVKQKVNIRTNPGVEAHTHSYIQTAKIDSKFGFLIENSDATEVINKILSCDNLIFNGLNCHIGSQIFDSNAFRLAVDVMTDYIAVLKRDLNLDIDELNVGGGFGIHYKEGDPKFTTDDYANYVAVIIESLNNAIETKNIKKPRLLIEPGRSLVGEAGITLYSVGNIRDIKGIKKYVCVDGGMFDNIRPGLYQAEYEAVLANRANDNVEETVTIAGKCCESADIIIEGIQLPKAKRGDIIATFATGAYNYSMASNYNRNFVPPVVFVENGKSAYAVKPQNYKDLVRNDVIPKFLIKD